VFRPSVAVAVIVLEPKLTGSVSDQFPEPSAVAEAIAAAPPRNPDASATTFAPGAVVPVTSTLELSIVVPPDGEVIVTGSMPGIPLLT
jgi:hypothetical protein